MDVVSYKMYLNTEPQLQKHRTTRTLSDGNKILKTIGSEKFSNWYDILWTDKIWAKPSLLDVYFSRDLLILYVLFLHLSGLTQRSTIFTCKIRLKTKINVTKCSYDFHTHSLYLFANTRSISIFLQQYFMANKPANLSFIESHLTVT